LQFKQLVFSRLFKELRHFANSEIKANIQIRQCRNYKKANYGIPKKEGLRHREIQSPGLQARENRITAFQGFRNNGNADLRQCRYLRE
jgi:hypothetical protein